MKYILPAIIPTSLSHLRETLQGVGEYTDTVQVDIVDGVFVPFRSWPHVDGGKIKDLAEFTKDFRIEIDLMVQQPEDVLVQYLEAGVCGIVVHLESCKDIDRVFEVHQKYDFELGLSINNDTPLDRLNEFVNAIDFVQLMGIAEIGSQGQPFDERVLKRIKQLKVDYPQLEVSVDGSVKSKTLPLLIKAGVDRCVSGSAILTAESPSEAYEQFVELFEWRDV